MFESILGRLPLVIRQCRTEFMPRKIVWSCSDRTPAAMQLVVDMTMLLRCEAAGDVETREGYVALRADRRGENGA